MFGEFSEYFGGIEPVAGFLDAVEVVKGEREVQKETDPLEV